jgi:hypothetical protein
MPNQLSKNPKLIVDTGNGKLCYKMQGVVPNLSLAGTVSYYEFADLFRDDKNPRNLDLMKFQMFAWTFVAIFIYAWLFLSELHDHIETLPRGQLVDRASNRLKSNRLFDWQSGLKHEQVMSCSGSPFGERSAV